MPVLTHSEHTDSERENVFYQCVGHSVTVLTLLLLACCMYSTADWKFGAEQFEKLLSDKVDVHCKLSSFACAFIVCLL
jgi:hypothetical protein